MGTSTLLEASVPETGFLFLFFESPLVAGSSLSALPSMLDSYNIEGLWFWWLDSFSSLWLGVWGLWDLLVWVWLRRFYRSSFQIDDMGRAFAKMYWHARFTVVRDP